MHGIFALVSQASFRGETVGGIANDAMTTAMVMSGKQKGLLRKIAARASNFFSLSLCTDKDVSFPNKLTHFQKKDFAPSLVLNVRVFGTLKWHNLNKIVLQLNSKVK